MKIIDAHLHFSSGGHFQQTAKAAGHLDTLEHLKRSFQEYDIVMGIGMGVDGREKNKNISHPLTINYGENEIPDFMVQCLGIDTKSITKDNSKASVEVFAELLKEARTVGIKVYAGYQHYYVNDPVYHPFYELAEAYDVPVVIHTGDTANAMGMLKYSHPLTVDEAAVNFPRVRFVMAHCGNPWIVDAVEVTKKNPNVYMDLSGLAEGKFDVDWFFANYEAYLNHLKMWLTYLGRYDKILYGSDWPLVNMGVYIEMMKRLIPKQYHAQVFYENALQVFGKVKRILDK